MIAAQKQKVAEKEAETDKKKGYYQCREGAKSCSNQEQTRRREKQTEQEIERISNEMRKDKLKTEADAVFTMRKKRQKETVCYLHPNTLN
eukprot:UN04507